MNILTVHFAILDPREPGIDDSEELKLVLCDGFCGSYIVECSVDLSIIFLSALRRAG